MDNNITTIIITLVTVLFGGGAWKFYEFLIRKKSYDKKEEKTEQTMYRDDLRTRVGKLEEDKQRCLDSLMDISNKLSALETKVEFLEKENTELKVKLQSR
jgi:flagellar motility protein MotE (MotC chaperone)